MALAKKRDQQRKAKERRQKQIAIGGAVILVAVLAIQLPKLMKSAHPSSSSVTGAVTTTTSTSTPPTGAQPTSATTPDASVSTPESAPAAAAAAGPVASSGLADTDPVQKAGQGQLVVFDRFESKDPFVQQISQQSDSSSGAVGSGAGQTAMPKPPIPPTPPTTTASALLSTNGVSQPVAVGDTFPAQDPTFELVSATATGAKIAIAGGSYADGSATVTLVKGKPLTLVNTKTGTRYTVLYVGWRK